MKIKKPNNSGERNLFYIGMKQFNFQLNGKICGTELHFVNRIIIKIVMLRYDNAFSRKLFKTDKQYSRVLKRSQFPPTLNFTI
jgi:hypothetical protein